jgi:hypothetical protein
VVVRAPSEATRNTMLPPMAAPVQPAWKQEPKPEKGPETKPESAAPPSDAPETKSE